MTVNFIGKYSGTYDARWFIFPAAPKSYTVKLYGHDDVKLSWSKSTGAEGYAVYYKKSGDDSYTYYGSTTKDYIKIKNLTDGKKYYFKLAPYCAIDGSNYYKDYDTKSIYTLKKVSTPKIKKASSSKIKISWTNISGESGYQIYRSTKKNSGYKKFETASYKYSSVTVKTTKNKTYYYKIRAYKKYDDEKVYGPWSEPVKYKLK